MITRPKGTHDIYGAQALRWAYVNDVIDEICLKYNYGFIRTPIFESSEVFHRGIGEETDIVSKETYDFVDRGDRRMTLRPEGTAGVIRSYIEDKMYGNAIQPVKLYYNGTMYRYERPQSGRDRELTQFGIEVIGSNDPLVDAEVISIPYQIYRMLGLKGLKVNINSLGDRESRENYKSALVEYLKPWIKDLCEDCQVRYKKNPLRILDCKADKDSDILQNAPVITNYLNEESEKHFLEVQKYLSAMEIDYEINHNIVRGLDYYSHTVFEIEATVEGFGAQNVLGGGGRYNDLVKDLGGPVTPGVGFAMGIGRLVLALEKEEIDLPINKGIDCYVMYVNDEEKEYGSLLTQDLRLNGFSCEIENMGRNLKSQFKAADRLETKFLIILNSEDLHKDEIKIKDNRTKEEVTLRISEVLDYLDSNI